MKVQLHQKKLIKWKVRRFTVMYSQNECGVFLPQYLLFPLQVTFLNYVSCQKRKLFLFVGSLQLKNQLFITGDYQICHRNNMFLVLLATVTCAILCNTS